MNPALPLGVVFDCMVFFQALIGVSGPSFACLELLESGLLTVYTSPSILSELRDVFTRPKLRRKFDLLTDERVEAFLDRLERYTLLCSDAPPLFDYKRDPKDMPYINLALSVKASHLVSRDNDLLDLMGKGEEGRAFRERFPGLTVLDPVAFLKVFASFEGNAT